MTSSAFVGSLLAMLFALGLAMLSKNRNNISIVLAGVAIHSLAQTILMILKLTADPEKHLASIEYWIMGGLSNITIQKLPLLIILSVICISLLFLLYRQILLISINEEEATLLGVDIKKMRMIVLILATESLIVKSFFCAIMY